MFSFEIGQQESGFYSGRTESQTDRITEPHRTVLVNRLAKHPPWVWFLSPSGGATPAAPPLGRTQRPVSRLPLSAALKKNKEKFAAENVRWVMRIRNMCLVLKLDKGKVVSIADEQNHIITESQTHTVPYQNTVPYRTESEYRYSLILIVHDIYMESYHNEC